MKRYLVASLLSSQFLLFNAAAQSSSQIIEDSIKSCVLNTTRRYTVYLPESYSQSGNRKYPVLYLLHGHSHRNNDWAKDGHLQKTADQHMTSGNSAEMIIITPDAGSIRNGYFNTTDGVMKHSFENLSLMLKQDIEFQDKFSRAIAGFSMGGGGAVAYALKYPDMFASVYAMSALMSLPKQGRPSTKDDESIEFGRSVLANDCIALVSYADSTSLDKLREIKWFVDCGDEDFLLDVNTEFYKEMRKAGIPCELRVRDGNHDWKYWRSSLSIALPFISDSFRK